MSHSRIFLSLPADARAFPSGLNATLLTAPGVTHEQPADRPAAGHIPQR
jgi:hypothetical protein